MWFRQLKAVAVNAFKVTVGDSFFLVINCFAIVAMLLMGTLPTFSMGEHIIMLREQCQALIFIMGCLAITFGMIRAVTDDLRRGSGSILMSRPVNGTNLLLGKWLGIMIGVIMLQVTWQFCYLWVSNIAHNQDHLNIGALIFYIAAFALPIIGVSIKHFLSAGKFVFGVNLAICLAMLVFFGAFQMTIAVETDWGALYNGAMLIIGLISFSAILLPFAVKFDSVAVLACGFISFFGGTISEYLINQGLGTGTLSNIVKTVIPNWQVFWVTDIISDGKTVPGIYYIHCGVHSLLFLVLFMIISTSIFKRTEIQGS